MKLNITLESAHEPFLDWHIKNVVTGSYPKATSPELSAWSLKKQAYVVIMSTNESSQR